MMADRINILLIDPRSGINIRDITTRAIQVITCYNPRENVALMVIDRSALIAEKQDDGTAIVRVILSERAEQATPEDTEAE